MEQDLKLYEFRMKAGNQAETSNAAGATNAPEATYSFEAPSRAVAETYRRYALIHFQETQGKELAAEELSGPFLVSKSTHPNQ